MKNKYNNPNVGCYIDESSGSADALNLRTIEFAADYGFTIPLFSGCFDGLRGSSIEMSLDDALSASHQGECDSDVEPEISAQLDALNFALRPFQYSKAHLRLSLLPRNTIPQSATRSILYTNYQERSTVYLLIEGA